MKRWFTGHAIADDPLVAIAQSAWPSCEQLDAWRDAWARGDELKPDEVNQIRINTATGFWYDLCRLRDAAIARKQVAPLLSEIRSAAAIADPKDGLVLRALEFLITRYTK